MDENKLVSNMKEHWENVYQHKQDSQTSWFETLPSTSLELVEKYGSGGIFIDVGCGNSHLTFELLRKQNEIFEQYFNVDISKYALERARELMNGIESEKLDRVKYIESNVLYLDEVLKGENKIDMWHDRATFHFLNTVEEQCQYLQIMSRLLKRGGFFIISAFASNGPTKCSGLPITQYTTEKWREMFEKIQGGSNFEMVDSFEHEHTTPFETTQNFLFCIFKKV